MRPVIDYRSGQYRLIRHRSEGYPPWWLVVKEADAQESVCLGVAGNRGWAISQIERLRDADEAE